MTNMTLQAMRQIIANDAYAITFQSLGQYRGALLRHFDSLVDAPTASSYLPDINHLEALARGLSDIRDQIMQDRGVSVVDVEDLVDRLTLARRAQPYATGGIVPGGLHLAGEGLQPLRAQPESEAPAPKWGRVDTVGDMVRNLLTLDQAAPIFTAYHVDITGQRRCRTRPVTISLERVVDGKWVDPARKDVPYANIVWAKPDERAQQAAAPGALDWINDVVREVCLLPGRDSPAGRDDMMLVTPIELHDIIERHSPSAPGTPEAPQTAAARDVLAERQRQVEQEGWTPTHDDQYRENELPRAASAYTLGGKYISPPAIWPWTGSWWKPLDARSNYVRAGALLLAEIERLDRAAQLDGGQGEQGSHACRPAT